MNYDRIGGRFIALIAGLFLLAAGSPAARAQGPLVAWGDDTRGVVSGKPAGTFVKVATNGVAATAIRPDGTLVSWGDDSSGQVSGTPAGTFISISVGEVHSVAIRSTGEIVAWGGDRSNSVSGPNADPGTFIDSAAGAWGTVALRSDGTIASWGEDYFLLVSGAPAGSFVSVADGPAVNFAVRTDGALVAWGWYVLNSPFSSVATTGTYSGAASDGFYTIGVRTDGTLGDLGFGSDGVGEGPGPAGTYRAIACGYFASSFTYGHFLALRTDGTLLAWGADDFGQVSRTPAGTFTSIAAGGGVSIAIATPSTTTPQARIEALIAEVQSLVNAGALSKGNSQALIAKLESAGAALTGNGTEAASGSLNAFISQVEVFVRTGRLTGAQGRSLIDKALALIADIGG